MFGGHGAAFHQRQQVSLHPFPGYIGALPFCPAGNLVQFIQKYDALLFNHFYGAELEFVLVDPLACFLFPQ